MRLCACAPVPLYAELHCHSGFSLLDGASNPEDLLARAAALGMPAVALTDHDDLGGAVRWAEAGTEHGVAAIIGVELTIRPQPDPRSPGAPVRPCVCASLSLSAMRRTSVITPQTPSTMARIVKRPKAFLPAPQRFPNGRGRRVWR